MKLDAKIPSGAIHEKWSNRKFEQKLVNPANKRKYKVIVVGSGLAGAAAAASMGELGTCDTRQGAQLIPVPATKTRGSP